MSDPNDLFKGLNGTIFSGTKPIVPKDDSLPINNSPDFQERSVIHLMNRTNGYVGNQDEINALVEAPNRPIEEPEIMSGPSPLSNLYASGVRTRRK